MCVMEVHAQAAKATMSQAIWHNTITIVNDCKMISEIMSSRGDSESASQSMEVCEQLQTAANSAFALFAKHVGQVKFNHDLTNVDANGHERTLYEIAVHAHHDAEKDYAR